MFSKVSSCRLYDAKVAVDASEVCILVGKRWISEVRLGGEVLLLWMDVL